MPIDADNQSPFFSDINLYETDRALREAVMREGGIAHDGALRTLGAKLGSAAMLEAGRLANRQAPELVTRDAHGGRVDRVDFHPSYHAMMGLSMSAGLHCGSWTRGGEQSKGVVIKASSGTNVARAAGAAMACQTEAGHLCPLTMTNASLAALSHEPALVAWLDNRLLKRAYDPSDVPIAAKTSLTIGMALTERQGGSDIRANTTRSVRAEGGDDNGLRRYRVTGEKWFVSAPMSDAHIVLAQSDGGPTAVFVPRRRADGALNGIRFERLKDKVGNRSNATVELTFEGAEGYAVGDEGRGIATLMEMATYTRLDCVAGSTGLMRGALARTLLHTRHRRTFGRTLAEHPIMARVLADMVLDVEAATALTFRLARAFDAPDDEMERAWLRLMTPVTKYWVCKMAPGLIAEAMECFGGNGYIEDEALARLYREAPVNAIWEGSGNIMCLDVLRVLQREPEAAEIVLELLGDAARADPKLAAGVARVEHYVHRPREIEANARAFVESLAMLAAGTILAAGAPDFVADAYAASRFAGPLRRTYGMDMPGGVEQRLIARAYPEAA